VAGRRMARFGRPQTEWRGGAGLNWSGTASSVADRFGRRGKEVRGRSRRGKASSGKAGGAWLGWDWIAVARPGRLEYRTQ
jgi:hypothetical protein